MCPSAKEAAIVYDRAVLRNNLSTSLLNFPGMVHNLDVDEPIRKRKRGKFNKEKKRRADLREAKKKMKSQFPNNRRGTSQAMKAIAALPKTCEQEAFLKKAASKKSKGRKGSKFPKIKK